MFVPALDYMEECTSTEADKEVEQSRTAEVQLISSDYTCLYHLIHIFISLHNIECFFLFLKYQQQIDASQAPSL